MRYDFCPVSGERLVVRRVLHRHWATLSESSDGMYLELSGLDKSDYPLLRISTHAGNRLMQADDQLVDAAFAQLKYIDYKTVSVVLFEEFLGRQPAGREPST